MIRKLQMLGICVVALTGMIMAQTSVTNGNDGMNNAVPVYTGSSTLGNSPISVSGGNVGIGTINPYTPLQVYGIITGGSGASVNGQVILEGYYGGSDNALAIWGGEYSSGAPIMGYGVTPSTSASGTFLSASPITLLPRAALTVGTSGNINFFTGAPQTAVAGSPVSLSQVMTILNGGNVGIGTTTPSFALEVRGNITLTARQGGSIIFQDGTTQNTAWTGTVCGGDYAESVDVAGDRTKFEPGDILVIDPDRPGKFLKSAEAYSTAVTGIYSIKPGIIGRRQTTPKSPDEVPMAMLGIVPTKVIADNGAIKPGDLLVTSSKVGYAMKGTDRGRMLGAIIGKAMGNLKDGTGVIEVAVTLQ